MREIYFMGGVEIMRLKRNLYNLLCKFDLN